MCAKAQESSIYHRVNLKLGHSNTPKFAYYWDEFTVGNIRLEGNYGLTNFVEVGGYFGYDKFLNFRMPVANQDNPETGGQFFYTYQSDALFYGINANFHIMPFFVKDKRVRLDIYLSAKIGAISMLAPTRSAYYGTAFDYGGYAGLAYYLGKNWGLFAEYGFNKKVKMSEMEPCLRYGVTVKF